MYTIRKKYTVEYAHQLRTAFSEGCWKTIHGHSGTVEVFFCADVLDKHNMVIDFGEISSVVKKYLMDNYDHALIMPRGDPNDNNWQTYLSALEKFNSKLFIVDENPTAEFFAKQMFLKIEELLLSVICVDNDRNFHVRKVRFHETDTGYAEYSPYDIPVDDSCGGCTCLPKQ